jgi:hypothetical protein
MFWSAFISLTIESNAVIALRLFKLANGGTDAHTVAHLMVNEKIGAAIEAGGMIMGGATFPLLSSAT